MHEVGIAQQILRVIESAASEHGEGRVQSARLRVGELSGVEPDQLRGLRLGAGHAARRQ